MPNLPVPNTLEVKIHWGTATAEIAQNVLHFLNIGGVISGQALADQLDTTIKGIFTSSGLATFIAPTLGIRNVGVRNLAIANQAEFLGAGAGVLGTGTGDPLPTAIAQAYTLRTALAGRSFRGRVYLSCWTEASSTGSSQATGVTAGLQFIDNIRTNLISAPNIHMSVVSRRSNGADRNPPLSTEVTLVQNRSTVWNTQRRRMQAGGAGVIALDAVPHVEMRPASELGPSC